MSLCKIVATDKPEYEHGLDSLHEVWPVLILEIVDSIIWISQSFSVQKGLYILASPTSLAFKLGAHLSRANVVISSQSSMASSYAIQEILP